MKPARIVWMVWSLTWAAMWAFFTVALLISIAGIPAAFVTGMFAVASGVAALIPVGEPKQYSVPTYIRRESGEWRRLS